jgi:hypothetical protein
MLNRIAKSRTFAVGLLCTLVVLASLDNLPDPPAVKPNPIGKSVLCGGNHVEAVFDQNQVSVSSHSAPLFPVYWFDFAKTFRARCIINCTPLVRQASDSSPPSLA